MQNKRENRRGKRGVGGKKRREKNITELQREGAKGKRGKEKIKG